MEKFEYDLAGRLSAATDPAGTTQRYAYDELNRLIEAQYVGEPSATVSNGFDALGLRVRRNDSAGEAKFEYDALGRVVRETDGSGRSIAYEYDSADDLAAITYADGSRVAYSYDETGNLTLVRDATGTYSYSYDQQNRPISLLRPDGSLTTYAYDARGSIVKVINLDNAGGTVSSYEYSYDGRGYIATESVTSTSVDGTKEQLVRSFSYFASGEVAGFAEACGSAITTTAYAYDNTGNRAKATIINAGGTVETIAYSYDADNRLIAQTSSLTGSTAYTYDAAGNITSKRTDGSEDFSYA